MPYVILAKGSPHEGGNMINQVLAIILYMSGLFDSKSIVKEVVWRKTQKKVFINPRWRLAIINTNNYYYSYHQY